MNNYHKKSHCKYLIKIHLVLVTKYRREILKGALRENIFNTIQNVSTKMCFKIDTIESDIDHLHILIDLPPTLSVQQIVHQIKQVSTYYAYKTNKNFLKQYYWKENTLFSDGYFACSTGDASTETIRKYIDNQG